MTDSEPGTRLPRVSRYPKAVPFPPGQEPRGGRQIGRAEAEALLEKKETPVFSARQAGLRVVLRRMYLRRKKMIVAYISGAKHKRLRLDLRRGKRVIARRTAKIKRDGTGRVIFRQRGWGRFEALVRPAGRKKKKLLTRSSIFIGRPKVQTRRR